jgi:uncharacterized protein YkwD
MGRHSRTAPQPMVMVAEQGRRGTTGTVSRRKRRKPVKTGLMATGAAVAVSAVAVSAGLLPTPNGSGGFSFQDDGSISQAQAGNATSASPTGGSDLSPQERTSAPASQGEAPSSAPVTTPPASRPPAPAPAPATPSAPPTTAPSSSASATTTAPSPSATPSASASQPATADTSPEGQVLTLVNVERAKIGCSPLVMDQPLAKLAEDFTKDMAQRNFFDHTDPDGDDPWERAKLAGITDLGGENIARGQADAAAVMDAWMNSPGHRANILNCDFKTLGVGAYFGTGGPWWTQDFGY